MLMGVNPIRFWWMKRRVHGGVRDGESEAAVLAHLGPPAERVRTGDQEVWRYLLGSAGHYDISYEVIMADGHVRASVWRSSLRRSQSEPAELR